MSIAQELVDVLLVEDDANDAELTIRQLNNHPLVHHIKHLVNGDDAINYFFEGDRLRHFAAPKIVLLDLNMPKVSGIEVIKKLKSNNRTKHIPIVVMTSSKSQADLADCFKLGIISYLVKPVTMVDFNKLIKEDGHYSFQLN